MAEEVEMTPVTAAEPPKANPLMKPAVAKPATLKLSPGIRKPGEGTATVGLKPGLKLPPKPGATVGGLKPGLKLPPKPGATVGGLKPGLKLPPKPGATVGGLKPGVKLPPKPVIRKPGATVSAIPLPKPIVPKPQAAAEAAPTPAPAAEPVKPAAPTATVSATPAPAATVSATPPATAEAPAPVPEMPKPMEALKAVTQKLKGITQEIPQQAILRKTGIIADTAMSEAQKEAAKHKTARISLSDAMGVAPVKNENAPMKTIRIKRPIDIPGATSAALKPQPHMDAANAPKEPVAAAATEKPAEGEKTAPAATITQRKTLKIARPGGGAVRPAGKFGIKRPSQAATKPATPTEGGSPDAPKSEVADIPDIPEMPLQPVPMAAVAANDGPAWLWTLSALVQAAACVAIGALAWLLYQNTQISYF